MYKNVYSAGFKENLEVILKITVGYDVEYLPYDQMLGAQYPTIGKI